jgi:hypothetical protein
MAIPTPVAFPGFSARSDSSNAQPAALEAIVRALPCLVARGLSYSRPSRARATVPPDRIGRGPSTTAQPVESAAESDLLSAWEDCGACAVVR